MALGLETNSLRNLVNYGHAAACTSSMITLELSLHEYSEYEDTYFIMLCKTDNYYHT